MIVFMNLIDSLRCQERKKITEILAICPISFDSIQRGLLIRNTHIQHKTIKLMMGNKL